MPRGQIPLPVLEAAIGVLLLTGFVLVLVAGAPESGTETAQLDAYARDAGRLLRSVPPRHENSTRLVEVAASQRAFEREASALERRLDRLLPANLLYQVRTPHGLVGGRVPDGVRTGTATLPTGNGPVTVRVWYG